MFRQLGVREFLPSQESLTTLSGLTCTATPVICVDAFASVTGYNTANLNLTRVPLYLKYLPAGAQSIDIPVAESQPSVSLFLTYEMSCSQCRRVCAGYLRHGDNFVIIIPSANFAIWGHSSQVLVHCAEE